MKELSLLFITRKHPPSIGGMQRMSYCLSKELSKKTSIDKITWGHSQLFLPVFIIKVIFRTFFNVIVLRRKYTVVCLGDAVISPLRLFIGKILHLPVTCIVHGLDITYKNKLYQRIVISSLRRMDLIICVSENTKRECMLRGIDEGKLKCIPNGVEIGQDGLARDGLLGALAKAGVQINNDAKILLTVGRLIKRKGVAEFIKEVFKDLHRDMPESVYLIVGEGAERSRIKHAIDENNLGKSVFLLGFVEEKLLHGLYASSDLFIMPNIEIKGDVEGFGIVALEASGYGMPVIASDLDGIKDAVKNDENGFLIPAGRYDIFLNKICHLLQDHGARIRLGSRAREHVRQFTWDKIADRYINAMEAITYGK